MSFNPATTPRWKRRALQASQDQNRPPTTFGGSKTPKSAKRSRTPVGDRFIASQRSNNDLDLARMALSFSKENAATAVGDPQDAQTQAYTAKLQSSVLFDQSPERTCDLAGAKILSFSTKAPTAKVGTANRNAALFSQAGLAGPARRRAAFRHIRSDAERVLDAPGLQQDFYLNLLDWGPSGSLAVALDNAVYLWNPTTGAIAHLCDTPGDGDHVTSIKWSGAGDHLAVALSNAEVQVWDASRMRRLRSWREHQGRVAALAWKDATLTTGAADSRIFHNDVRAPSPRYAVLQGHAQEVCGLAWSPNGSQLASGGNDNAVCVWETDARHAPTLTLDAHCAAVKALAWCPLRANLLASGGGTADQHVRFWNTASGACVKAVNTRSQVSGIQWSRSEMELVTSHGFAQNQLTVWKYSSMARMAELKGHSERILHLAQSPDGNTVVSGGADETLRFWKVFDNAATGTRRNSDSRKQSSLRRQQARLDIR